MRLSIPPKAAVAQVLGFIKGKSAIHIPWPVPGTEEGISSEFHYWAPQLFLEERVERRVKPVPQWRGMGGEGRRGWPR